MQYQGNNTAPLILDYFIVGDPSDIRGPTAAFIEFNVYSREIQDTGLQRSRCDCWNIGSFSSYLSFCSVGKTEEKPRTANPKDDKCE
jgi:hypothetical protein